MFSERKRSKIKAVAEVAEVAPPPPPETVSASAAAAPGGRSVPSLPQPTVFGAGAAEKPAVGMDVEGTDGKAAAAAAAPVEMVEGKKVRDAWEVIIECLHCTHV